VEADLPGVLEGRVFGSWAVIVGGSLWVMLRFLGVALEELMAFKESVLGRFLEGALVRAGWLFLGDLFAPLLCDWACVCTIVIITRAAKRSIENRGLNSRRARVLGLLLITDFISMTSLVVRY
jgi:hypothetical protein